MRRFPVRFALALIMLVGGMLAGCASPDAVGVQDRGQIVGRIYNAKTQAAVTSGQVAVGSINTNSQIGPGGEFSIMAPIGQQTLTVIAPGYEIYSVEVFVAKNQPATITVPLNPTSR